MKIEDFNNKTIFFDLDGTLISPRKRLYHLFTELTGSNLSYEKYWSLKIKGYNQKKMLEIVSYGGSYDQFYRLWFNKIERPDLLKEDTLIKGTKESLTILQRAGFIMHLVTNRQDYDALINQLKWFDLLKLFTQIITTQQQMTKDEAVKRCEDIGFYEHAIFVGDSSEDMEAARKLNDIMVLINANSDTMKKRIEADYYFESLCGLLKLLRIS